MAEIQQIFYWHWMIKEMLLLKKIPKTAQSFFIITMQKTDLQILYKLMNTVKMLSLIIFLNITMQD